MLTVWQWLLTFLWEPLWAFFLNGFCVHLVRPLVVLVPLLVIGLGVGRELGIPHQFLLKSRYERFIIGTGIGMLIWQALLAGYLFEGFATNYTMDRPPFCERRLDSAGDSTDPDDRRYRMVPSSVGAITCYGGHILVAGAFAVVLVWLGLNALTLIRRWGAMKPPREAPTPTPLPHWWPVLLGGLFAVGVMTAAGWLLLPGEFLRLQDDKGQVRRAKSVDELNWAQQRLYWIGDGLIDFAGYGRAAERDAGWGRVTRTKDEAGSPAVAESAPPAGVNPVRSTLVHYYPVYGLFVLGSALVAAFTVLWAIRPLARLIFCKPHVIAPASWLIAALQLLLFAETVVTHFWPFPHLAWPALGLAVVLFARAYKLKHPRVTVKGGGLRSLKDYFKEVQERYAERWRAKQKAGEQGAGRNRQVFSEALFSLPAVTATPADSEKVLLATEDIRGWPKGRKKPLVLVCVSGGGSRAMAWTLRVLTKLERRIEAANGPAFPYHIRLVTGASGGHVAAAEYVASLPPPVDGRLPPGRSEQRVTLTRRLRADFLNPLVRALFGNDLPALFLPRYIPRRDRGLAFEQAVEQDCPVGLAQTFDQLLDGEREGWRPSLVFSPMMIEDGRQLLISNLDLLDVYHNRCIPVLGDQTDDPEKGVLSREAMEFFRLFPHAKDFRLSTAARMTHTFPYAFPAVPLPTDPRRRVVDAGYYDNYGVGLASAWLFNNMEWVRERASKVAVVQIRDDMSADFRKMNRPTDAPLDPLGLALEWLTSPPHGQYQARVAATAFRNDNLLTLLHQTFEEWNRSQDETERVPFVTPVFEFPAGDVVSLQVCLTEDEQQLIAQCLPGPGEKRTDDKKLAEEVGELERRVNDFVNWFVKG